VKLVRSAVLVATVAATVLAPTAADARSHSSTDTAGDVVIVTMSDGTTTPAPDRTEGDIVGTQVRHKARVVVLTMHFQELTAGQTALHWFGIKTGKMTRIVLMPADASHPGGVARLFKPDNKAVRCRIRHTIDYTANTATVKVPRSCLGKPRWVKVAMQEASPVAGSQGQVYADDSISNGGFLPVYGPRVRR
jgi:hypothetical protein